MPEPEYASFSEEEINRTVETARRPYEGVNLRSAEVMSGDLALKSGTASFRAQCLEIVSQGNQVCLRLPFGLPPLCVPIDLPDGTAVQACLDICTHWGIPTGVCVSLTVAGNQIFRQCFLWC